MQLTLTSQAETFLTTLLADGKKSAISGFMVGTTSGFTPSKDGSTVTGSTVYTGGPEAIKYSLNSIHEMTLMLTLDHDIGAFDVGNLMVFLTPTTGSTPIPFLWVTLNSTTNKNASVFSEYEIGNRIIIHATIYFPYITSVLNMTQHELVYAKFITVTNEQALNSVDTAEYDQYVIDSHTNFNATTLVVKDNEHSLWWAPMFNQPLADPYIGMIRGGISGEGYGYPSDISYIDCRIYAIDNSDFDTIDGGANWVPATETPVTGETY